MKVNLERMRTFRLFDPRWLPSAFGLFVSAIAIAAPAQDAQGPASGVPQDWSHRHLIYSNPETLDEAVRNGTVKQWTKKANDPRFVLALEKKEKKLKEEKALQSSKDAAAAASAAAVPNAKKKPSPSPSPGDAIHRDWSNVMGGASGSGGTRTYPAKFSFFPTTKDCVADFVVFTTSAAGAASAGTFNSRPGTFTAAPAAGGTVTITNTRYTPSQVLTLTADASVNTGLRFAVGTTATQAATNLANAIARNGGTVGVTATSAAGVVTVTSITTAVTNGNLTYAETLTNFTLGTQTAGTGTPGQPTIFALTFLYADTTANGGCQTPIQAVPVTWWSYNTGTGAVADLSPVLSFYDNGAQVAFMQRSAANVSSLVLLKWNGGIPGGTMGVPTAPTSVTPANYRTCTAPCMTVMTLSGNVNDTNSAPFVDYGNDILYVGDDGGNLHKFTGVFQGTPQEVGAPFATVSAGNVLSSPVYDNGSQLVFVGSNCAANTTNCNRLHSVSTGGVVVNSGAIGSGSVSLTTPIGGNGVRDAPIVDTAAQRVYAFIGADNSANGSTDSLGNVCASGPCAAVFQFATNASLASQNGGLGAKVTVGESAGANDLNRAINSGGFDDAYYSTGSGALYVCGSLPATPRRFTLWKIALSSSAFSARTQGPQINNANGVDVCSPVTVFKNGGTEYLYASVANDGSAAGGGGCVTPANGCIYVYDLTNTTWVSTMNATAALAAPGGTGGIIVDNTATGGGSQVYFSTRTSPGIAVQATQAGLN
jgi:hypothetical protein